MHRARLRLPSALIQVWDNRKPGRPLALIGYDWEKPSFYRKWYRGREGWQGMVGAQLAEGASQGCHADEFLGLFRQLLSRPDNVKRIPRHYAQYRAAPAFNGWLARLLRK